ncbi:MAG: division/cell wall cluster transcriptional repressor MraZ [Candidatus Saccharibacteria bacterium]
MFVSEYQHSLDPKGRLTVPAKFRDGLGDIFMATKGLDDPCLFVFPIAEWTEFEQKLKTLPLTSKKARAFVRFFMAGASECEVDKQGRIILPANLREWAGIDKDVTIIGAGNRVEIWARDKWENFCTEAKDDFVSDLAEELVGLGI